jgi:2-keto-4-pentenoate hydratase/2-oxohepta-3-ene-1,7-dioic acid hydratase in catechol pathway
LGYVPANDVSCDNVDDRDHHLARSKSADGFCPLGQYVDTDYDFRGKKILAYHNNTLLREGNTNQIIWDPERIVVWLADWMTLYPGDVVITGTPSRVRDRMFLKDGDTYTVKIEGFPDLVTKFYE